MGLCCLALGTGCDKSNSLGEEPTSGSDGGSTSDGTDSDDESSGGGSEVPAATVELLHKADGKRFDHLTVRDDGAIAVAGEDEFQGTFGDAAVFNALHTSVYDADGNTIWGESLQRELTQADEFEPIYYQAIATGSDGSTYVAAIDYTGGPDAKNHAVKFDAAGTRVWEAPLEGRPQAITPLPDGRVLVAGYVGDESNPNATRQWAALLDAEGLHESSRYWENEFGRNNVFNAAAVTPEGRVLLGGTRGTDPASSRADAFLTWVDEALTTEEHVFIEGDGATHSVFDLRLDDAGNGIALAALADFSVVTYAPDGEVVHTETMHPDLLPLSAHSSTGYLATELYGCDNGDQDNPIGCDTAVFYGVVDGQRQWRAAFEGCGVASGYSISDAEAIVAVTCGTGSDEAGGLATELYRITAP